MCERKREGGWGKEKVEKREYRQTVITLTSEVTVEVKSEVSYTMNGQVRSPVARALAGRLRKGFSAEPRGRSAAAAQASLKKVPFGAPPGWTPSDLNEPAVHSQ